jgi:tripartite-type tricarboxylate transporter receptor subunit TctC
MRAMLGIRGLVGLGVALLVAMWTVTATAQQYPTKPIRLIIPFPPGGSNDVVGRSIAVQLSQRLDKPVIVENVGGAGGLIGTEMAAKAAPDGYTLVLISVAFAFNPSIYKLPYDPATAFTPVAVLAPAPRSSPSLPAFR